VTRTLAELTSLLQVVFVGRGRRLIARCVRFSYLSSFEVVRRTSSV